MINGTHGGDPPLLTALPVSFKEAEEARSLSSTRDKWTARKRASAKRGKILADRNAMKTKRALLCQREREGERADRRQEASKATHGKKESEKKLAQQMVVRQNGSISSHAAAAGRPKKPSLSESKAISCSNS